MSQRLVLLLVSSILLLTVIDVVANDSIARIGAGGITLTKTDKVRMLQEVLEISTHKVRVRYRFLNESDAEIRDMVAFPMPPYGYDPGLTNSHQGPLNGFKLLVASREVPPHRHRAAFIGGQDVTDRLRNIGLSERQIFETFGDTHLNKEQDIEWGLTPAQATEVERLGGKRNSISPWVVVETAYWEQIFPARKEIEVVHEYPPFVGGSYREPYQNGPVVPVVDEEQIAESCVDERTQQALTRRVMAYAAKGANIVRVSHRDVEYILGTARNWKGPISDFTLRIVKDSPEQIVSLCFPGKPRRVNPTTLEFTQSGFVPPDKVVVYFYDVSATH